MDATAFAAASPMQSSAKATGRPSTSDRAAATGFRDCFASRPFGRPKWDKRTTLPPLSAISWMVGITRSRRVAVGDAPVLHRHVEVDADEDALALQIGAVERADAHPRQAPQQVFLRHEHERRR